MAKETEEKEGSFSSKEMLTENAAKKTVIRYADRVQLEIVKATRHYKFGDKIAPHKVMAEALIKQGIAKEAKDK